MNPLEQVNDLVSNVGEQVDKNVESGEERQKQLTERQRIDMMSDSWLSKNIRPMTLIFLGVLEGILVIAAAMEKQIDVAITSQVGILFGAAVGFYFDSKRRERIADKNASANMKLKELELKHEQKLERREQRQERREARRNRRNDS